MYFERIFHGGLPVIRIPRSWECLSTVEMESRVFAQCGKTLKDFGAIGFLIIDRDDTGKRKLPRRGFRQTSPRDRGSWLI